MAGRGPVVRVEGAKELARAFRAAGGATRELSAAYRAIARELVGPARSEAPRDSGRLAASVRGTARATSAALQAGGARLVYAGPVHFGVPRTRTYPARKPGALRSSGTLGAREPNPFLYRAIDSRRDEVLEAYERNVAEVLRRHELM